MRSDELYETITSHVIDGLTNAIIDEVIDGEVLTWRPPWRFITDAGIPLNVTGRPYRGINAFWLPMEAEMRGFTSRVWGTYRMWQQAGGQVVKGSKGAHVFLWKEATSTDTDTDGNETKRKRLITKTYAVFNADQVEGSADIVAKFDAPPEMSDHEPIDEAAAFFNALPSIVRVAGNRAYYSSATDSITMPPLGAFFQPEHYYSTLAHEHVHWTGHPTRLDRDLVNRFGSEAYAAEELIAELGAAMWCGQHGIVNVTRADHVGYLKGWVKVLSDERNALVTAASKAQQAIDYMAGLVSQELAA